MEPGLALNRGSCAPNSKATSCGTSSESVLAGPFASALDRFEAIGRVYVRHAIARPAQFRIMFGAHMHEVQSALSPVTAGRKARRVLEDAAGEVAAELGGDITALQVVQVGWSSMVGLIMLVLERELGPELSPQAIEAMLDTVMGAVRAGLQGLATDQRSP